MTKLLSEGGNERGPLGDLDRRHRLRIAGAREDAKQWREQKRRRGGSK